MSSAASMTTGQSLLIQEQLKKIWQAYRAAGTTENQEIVEALAIRLIVLAGKSISVLPEYARPTLRPGRATPMNIQLPLQQALQFAGDAATLFDRYLLFHEVGRAPGALYPLPRHLVDCMIRLLNIEPFHSFADFTCGSGGFLVNRNNAARNARAPHGITLGIDKEPALVRLAGANLLLHDLAAECKLLSGNSLRLCAPTNPTPTLLDDLEPQHTETEELLRRQLFDRIAMAAPFGEDTKGDARLWSKDGSNASEDIFTRLALSRLANEGRAALLVPSSLTWKETMTAFRERLVNQHTVHAIISLPKSALSPFNAVNASILLFSKEASPPDHQIWLLKVSRDGYEAEAERDLLMPPERSPEQNDLPLIEAIFPTPPSCRLIKSSGLSLAPISLRQNEQFHGLLLQAVAKTKLETLLLFRIAPSEPGGPFLLWLLVKTSHPVDPPHTILIPFTSRGLSNSDLIFNGTLVFSDESKAREYIQATHGLQRVPDGVSMYHDGRVGQSIVISYDGRVLGITLPRSAIEGNDLQPERYVPEPERAFMNGNPVETINAMRQQQPLTASHLDNLLSQLEVKPVVAADLPPRLLPRAGADKYSLEQALGTDQQAIWQWILATQKYTHEQQEYPRYFTAQEVITAFPSKQDSQDRPDWLTTQATLDLFVSMGLLVSTLIVPPELSSSPQQKPSPPRRPFPCYRLITMLDITDLNSEEGHP